MGRLLQLEQKAEIVLHLAGDIQLAGSFASFKDHYGAASGGGASGGGSLNIFTQQIMIEENSSNTAISKYIKVYGRKWRNWKRK